MEREDFDRNNLNELVHQVASIGVREDISDYLRERIKSGAEFFSIKSYESIENNPGTLGIFLIFGKLDDGKYILTNYRASLYHTMDIDHVEIPGIDTKALEKKMNEFNWEYDIEENEDEWVNAVKEAYDIENTLRILSQQPKGDLIAMQLWNNHVPLKILHKPGFITQAEDKLKMYPSLNFSAVTPITEAYEQLKNYREIERNLSGWDIDDLKHKQTQAFIIHRLLKDNEYSVSMPVSPPLSELIKHYHVIEHSHPGHQVFEEGHEITTLAIKLNFDDAIKVLKVEVEKAKTDWKRKSNDFAIIGEELGKTLRLTIDCRPVEDSSVLLAISDDDYSLGNGENAFKIKVINHPLTTRHQKELTIRYESLSQEIKLFDKDGYEYKDTQKKYFEKASLSINDKQGMVNDNSSQLKHLKLTKKSTNANCSPDTDHDGSLLTKNVTGNVKGMRK